MKNNESRNSRVFDMVEEELRSINQVKDVSVSLREFNVVKFPPPKHYTSKDVVRIRKEAHVSQAVFARILNASQSTVRKWEIGAKKPSGSNRRLLQIIENKGLEVLSV